MRAAQAIVKISREDLRPGFLGDLFRHGTRAAIVTDDARIRELWAMLPADGQASQRAELARPPWESRLLDVAGNHHPTRLPGSPLGDALHFVPGTIGLVSRRSFIRRDPSVPKALSAIPAVFGDRDEAYTQPGSAVDVAWRIASDVLSSSFPPDAAPREFGVLLAQHRYSASREELDRLFSLVYDAVGTWARLGFRIDIDRAMAVAPFDRRFVRDLYALACQIPALGRRLRALNESLRPRCPLHTLPEDARVIGAPHVDSLFVTCIASRRETLRTEIFDGERWVHLPLTTDSVAIFPSALPEWLGIEPTLHRVLHLEGGSSSSPPNLSLVLGPRPLDPTFADPELTYRPWSHWLRAGSAGVRPPGLE